MLFFLMSALLPLRQQMSGLPYDPVEGDPVQRGILLSGYLLTIPIFLFNPSRAFQVVSRGPVPWLMILWAAITILWSGSAEITVRRVIAVLLTTLYVLVLYLRYPFQSFLRLLGTAFFIAIFSSLLMVAFKPDWGIMSSVHLGAWEGVFVHKNSLGKVSVFALCFFTMLGSCSRNRRERVFWAGAILLGAIALVGSRSATALVVLGTMVLGAIVLRVGRPWRKVWPVFILLILLVGSGVVLWAIQNREILVDALGRDASLTGRVPLWQVLLPMGLENPLGYGYGAFWLGLKGPSAEVWHALGWAVPNAHNGFLELWLHLGWVGLGLGIILLGRIFTANLERALAGSHEAIFWILFCIIFTTYNFVEVNLFNQNNIYWVLLAYAYFSTQSRPSEDGFVPG
jgi:exopolysaccharide production protein ExoQ